MNPSIDQLEERLTSSFWIGTNKRLPPDGSPGAVRLMVRTFFTRVDDAQPLETSPAVPVVRPFQEPNLPRALGDAHIVVSDFRTRTTSRARRARSWPTCSIRWATPSARSSGSPRVGSIVFAALTVMILTIYFMMSLPRMRQTTTIIVLPRQRRKADRVLDSSIDRIGGCVTGNLITSSAAR